MPNLYHPTNKEQTAGCIEELAGLLGLPLYKEALYFRLALHLAESGDAAYLSEVLDTLKTGLLPESIWSRIDVIQHKLPVMERKEIVDALYAALDDVLSQDGARFCGGYLCHGPHEKAGVR